METIKDSARIQAAQSAQTIKAVWAYVLDLVDLTKPRILLLLLISTCCPMILASAGTVPARIVVLTLIGGALLSASASAINCVWDRDIDSLMERTKNRPIAAGRVSPTAGIVFAVVIGMLGLLTLAVYVNPMAAFIGLFGHLFYVFVYTIWLKRSTPQNIVIGGAAGAMPPLVGWAAVTGDINLTALLLFLIIFLWTPPHFWALALNKNSDYQKAGVPMMPLVQGEKATHLQMFAYALSLIPVSVLLVITDPNLGWVSMFGLLVLGAIFALKTYKLKSINPLHVEEKTKQSWNVFGFSLIYLALFFVLLVVDSTLL